VAKILVIDDDSYAVKLMEAILTDWHHQVLTAYDGPSGAWAAKTHRPDLIISDFLMPGVPGESLFDLLDKQPETREIPLFVVSGIAPDKIQSYIPAKHWSHIFQKPVDRDRLQKALDEILASQDAKTL